MQTALKIKLTVTAALGMLPHGDTALKVFSAWRRTATSTLRDSIVAIG